MTRNRLMLVLTPLALTLLLAGQAASQDAKKDDGAAAPKQPDSTTYTRVYDVRDMTFVLDKRGASTIVPPTRLGQRAPLAHQQPTTRPAGADGPPERTPESLAEEVVNLVRETVDPESWRDNGGTVGAIRALHGVLIVTQSAENHDQIVSVFQQLRETKARMITVRARWVALSAADLKAVAKPLEEDPTLHAVDLAALEPVAGKSVRWEGQVTFFNAMTVQIASGRARTVVTEQVPVVGTETMGYQPGASLVQAGLLLDVTAVLSPDGSRVMLNLQSVASGWEKPPGAAGGAGPAAAATRPSVPTAAAPQAEIDRIEMVVQQMHTSVSLPTGRPVIIGGMTLDPGEQGGAEAPRQLYLIVEASGTKGEDWGKEDK